MIFINTVEGCQSQLKPREAWQFHFTELCANISVGFDPRCFVAPRFHLALPSTAGSPRGAWRALVMLRALGGAGGEENVTCRLNAGHARSQRAAAPLAE